MNRPTFSLLFTSARQHLIPKVIDLWESRAERPFQVEHIIVTDGGLYHGEWDGTLDWTKLPRFRFKFDAVKNPPHNCTRGWNLAAKMSTGKILVLVSDDIVPHQGWDKGILDALTEACHERHDSRVIKNPDDEWVMHVDDGTEDKKLTHAIMSRARYEKLGYFFHPSYESMFNDRALWFHALKDGVIIDAKHLLFDHEHFYFWKREQDAVDKVHSSDTRYETGKRLFEWHEKNGFPPPFGKVPESKGDYVAYMQVNKDDFFLEEICKRLMEEGVEKFFFHVPTPSWSGAPVGAIDLGAITDVADSLKKAGCKMATVFVHKSSMEPGEHRINRETRTRNGALYELRKMGHPFILIVDGDELWKRGTLDKVHVLAQEGVQAIATSPIDVAGMPAYPIDSEGHTVMIYVGPDTDLCYCRVPYAPVVQIEGLNVYHFSGVRRTRDELIQKMRDSGHYDEPRYHFERFISETLPRIKPGAEKVHMYDQGARWKVVRSWSDEDWAEIPTPIREFIESIK